MALEEHKLWEEARRYYANFKVRSRGEMVFWGQWLKYANENGYRLEKEEEGGTDEYDAFEAGRVVARVKIHLFPKPRQDETRFPMSCNCPDWRTTHKCIHCDKLAQLILAFANSKKIPRTGERWTTPPERPDKPPEGEAPPGGEEFDTDTKTPGREGGEGKGGDCPACEGSGNEKCKECGGTGKDKGGEGSEDCPECEGSGQSDEPCKECGGTGEKGGGEGGEGEGEAEGEPADCPTCKGTGEIQAPDLPDGYQIPCPDCQGTGKEGGDREGRGGQGQGQQGEEGEGGGGEGGEGDEGEGEKKGGEGESEEKPRYKIGDRVTIKATGKTGIVTNVVDKPDGGQRLTVEIEEGQ